MNTKHSITASEAVCGLGAIMGLLVAVTALREACSRSAPSPGSASLGSASTGGASTGLSSGEPTPDDCRFDCGPGK